MKNKQRLNDLMEIQTIAIASDGFIISSWNWLNVGDVMSDKVATICPDDIVISAAKIMSENKISCLVVIKSGNVEGIITETDVLRMIGNKSDDFYRIKLGRIMSSPVTTVPSNLSVFSAGKLMEEMNIRRLVVVKDESLCGVLTQTDIFMAVRNKLQDEEGKNLKSLEDSRSNIYKTNLDGMITYINPAFMELLEVSWPDELIGQPFLPERFWLDPRERNQFLRELEKRSIENRELTLKTSKGKKIYVTIFPGFTKDAYGEINGS